MRALYPALTMRHADFPDTGSCSPRTRLMSATSRRIRQLPEPQRWPRSDLPGDCRTSLH